MISKKQIPQGFTLVEISIVVTIIVIIAVAILTSINPLTQIFKGYDARRKADLSRLKTAFEDYYTDHDCYPPKETLDSCGSDALAPYLSEVPCDPNDKSPYSIVTLPAGSTCPQKFAIYAPIISFFDKQADQIYGCPNTIAVHSTDILNAEITNGCGGKTRCSTKYGCNSSGECVIVSIDSEVSCKPYACTSDCGVTSGGCKARDSEGNYANLCK